MIAFPKPRVIGPVATLVAVVAVALTVSLLSGEQAIKSCLAAIVVSGLAGCGGLIPIIYAAAHKPALLTIFVLAATVIRLLLMVMGSIIIILFAKVSVLWFAVWIGIFYLVMLSLEIYFAIHTANRCKIAGTDKF
ncbi:MAG: hypothetical protein ABSG82_03650 [Sedimentisphaerales bacterium]|jgi:hypothetical protein